ARELVEAVVEAEPIVVQPAHVRRATLVALGLDPLLDRGVGHRHHPPLTRRNLLVRVEAERRWIAAGADGDAAVRRAERLARVLHDREPLARGELLERRHLRGIAED